MKSRIAFEKLSNTRDLGGYKNKNGKTIKEGMLFRSGHLFFASPKDIKKLEKLKLSHIVDFRSELEQEEKPDPVIENALHIKNPAVADAMEGITREEKAAENVTEMILRNIIDNPDFAVDYMKKLYIDLVSSDAAARAYSDFIRLLASEETSAVLWHCTAGKDRAGFASILTLYILDVDKETIKADYLYTNECLAEEIDELVKMLSDKLPIQDCETAIRNFFGACEDYIESALEYIDKSYGGMDNFIDKQLGISKDTLSVIREKYLY